VAVLHLATLVLGRATRPPDSPFGLVWPAAGVAFCWLWAARGTRAWVPSLVAVTASVAVVTAATGGGAALTAGLALANVLQAVVAVRFHARRRGPLTLSATSDLWWLSCTAALSSAVGGLVGAGTAAVVDGTPFLGAWGQWTVRSAVSLVVIAAVAARWRQTGDQRPLAVAGRGERAAMVLAFPVGYAGVFFLLPPNPLVFLALPLSGWFALRRSTRATTLHVLGCALFVVTATVTGHGPFMLAQGPVRVVLAQLFIALVAVGSLLLALHRDEHDRLVLVARTAERVARDRAALLAAVFDSTSDGLSVFDRTGTAVLRNRAADGLLGLSPDGTTMAAWRDHFGFFDVDGDPVPADRLPVVRALGGERVDAVDLVVKSLRHPQGLTLSVSAHPLVELPGVPWSGGVVAAYHDVTHVRRAAADVRRARDLFEGVLDAATEQSIVGTDPQGRITVFNDGARRMLGWTPEEVLGATPERFHDPAEVVARAAELGVAPGFEVFVHRARRERHETRQWTYRTRDGRALQVVLTVTAMRDEAGELTGFIGVATDLTERIAAQERLADSEQVFRLGFDTAPVGMVMVALGDGQPRGRLLRVNRALVEFTGFGEEALLEREILDLVHPDDVEECRRTFEAVTTEEVRCERRFLHADGSTRWGSLSAVVVRPSGGAQPYLMCLVEDVTARRTAEQELEHQALHDGLTGLPNRSLFRDRLEGALAGPRRTGAGVGVLFVDLDGFKAVNDTAGHAAGDELLQHVAELLRHCVRPGDTVARLGGDEFAVVCPEAASVDDLQAVGDRILAVLGRPVPLTAGTVRIGASIGIRLSEAGTGADRLLQDADAAMYAAKKAGKNRCVVHPVRDAARDGLPAGRPG
jgi:diguanylate cyclase (GGDEF)-like protein/PAS domain S-box-containing protein